MTRLTLEDMRRLARLGGFEWTDDELEAVRPALERALASLETLEHVPLGGAEPTTLYRVL